MWCAVLNREGETLLIKATDTGESPGPNLQTDAWRASIEIAEAKAYTALSVSSNDLALDSRTVGLATRTDVCLSSPCGAPGTPLRGLWSTRPLLRKFSQFQWLDRLRQMTVSGLCPVCVGLHIIAHRCTILRKRGRAAN